MCSILLLTCSLLLAGIVVADGPTPIYINQVPAYSSMSTCAIKPVSSIVRNMESGCGDGSQTTSYACFCIASSITFNTIISKAVASNCNNDTVQASSALDVFHSYCQLGNVKPAVTSTSSAPLMTSATATPAASASSTGPSPTSTASAEPATSSSLSTGGVIAVAVTVSIGVILIGAIIGMLFWRRHRRTKTAVPAPAEKDREGQPYIAPLEQDSMVKKPMAELPLTPPPPLTPAELESPSFVAEMPGKRGSALL